MTALPNITIEEFRPAEADRATQESMYALARLIDAESWPDEPPTPFEDLLHEWLDPPLFTEQYRWLARGDDGVTVIASARVSWSTRPENPHLGHFWISVHPDARRSGIATRLLELILTTAHAHERTTLETWTTEGGDGVGFLAAMGGECRLVSRKSSLATARIDRVMMESWLTRAKERAQGWSLIGWDGACPDEYLERFVDLEHVMNTAPRGIDMEDWKQTPEMYRNREKHYIEMGYEHWVLVARRDSDGLFGGFTELTFIPSAPWLCWQGGTGVLPECRNLGLGRWLKAAMAVKLLDDRPHVQRIDTMNAFVNEPMLNINITMGFELVSAHGDWQLSLPATQAVLRQKLG